MTSFKLDEKEEKRKGRWGGGRRSSAEGIRMTKKRQTQVNLAKGHIELAEPLNLDRHSEREAVKEDKKGRAGRRLSDCGSTKPS